MTEVWRTIPGLGDYEASSLGSIRRKGATVARKPAVSKRDLYLRLPIQGKCLYVHRLVALAFHGAPPLAVPQVNHIDRDPRNNASKNLEWVTPSENENHARATGKNEGHPFGEQIAKKLTLAQVREIYALKGKLDQRAIASRFGISKTLVGNIHRGVSWSAARAGAVFRPNRTKARRAAERINNPESWPEGAGEELYVS